MKRNAKDDTYFDYHAYGFTAHESLMLGLNAIQRQYLTDTNGSLDRIAELEREYEDAFNKGAARIEAERAARKPVKYTYTPEGRRLMSIACERLSLGFITTAQFVAEIGRIRELHTASTEKDMT